MKVVRTRKDGEFRIHLALAGWFDGSAKPQPGRPKTLCDKSLMSRTLHWRKASGVATCPTCLSRFELSKHVEPKPESVSPHAKTHNSDDDDSFDAALDSWISDEKKRHRARSTADKRTTNEMGRVILAWRLACKCDCAGCQELRELVDRIIISVHSGVSSKTNLGKLVHGLAEAALGLTTPEDHQNVSDVLKMLGVE